MNDSLPYLVRKAIAVVGRVFFTPLQALIRLKHQLAVLNVAFIPLTVFSFFVIGGSITLPIIFFTAHKTASLPTLHPSNPRAVLGAQTIASPLKLTGTLVFNVPTEVDNDLTVNGSSTFNGPVTIKGKELDVATITASNVVYNIKAGNGLTVSGTQNPTITNNGVLSFQGTTGDVTLTAGSGISIDGTKISSTVSTSTPNTFGTITDGTNSFSAGSSNDTLKFIAGSGISISLDTTNKNLTITNSGVGGSGVNLSGSVTGVLGVANGGLGADLSGSAAIGDLLYANSTSTFARLADIASGSCLLSAGVGIAPAWGSCGGSTNYWQLASGVVAPANSTNDLVVGGNSTSSAKFHVSGTSGNITATGTLTGLTGFTSSGTIDFSSLTSNGVLHTTGGNGTLGVSTVALGSEVSGMLPVGNGGTGTNTFTVNGVLYGNGTSAVQMTASGSANQVLAVNTQGVPTWTDLSAGSGGCSNCLSSDPSSTQTIQPTGNVTGLSISQTTSASPTADIFDVTNSSGTVKYIQVDSSGNVVLNGNDLQIGGTSKMKVDDTNLANATDTFTYDTSSDVDSGAWTDNGNAQASSWYNETIANTGANCVLGTDTRCGTRPFPKKAIIIATNTHLYIFDATDDSLWMAFNEGTNYVLNGSPTLSSVFALNGVIYIGTSTNGLLAIDFVNDRIAQYDYNAGAGGKAFFLSSIANRNSGKGFGTRASWGQIAADKVTGVFARVINGKTYVAVSTFGGASVINVTDQKVIRYVDN